jgi:hypothetical protein
MHAVQCIAGSAVNGFFQKSLNFPFQILVSLHNVSIIPGNTVHNTALAQLGLLLLLRLC